jgi:predicted nuclease with TOPRIM domain
MNLFDKAREAFGQAAAAVSTQAEQLSLQAQLGNLESERDRMYIEVGKRARELRQQRAFVDEQIDVLLRRITDIEAQMDELRKQALAGQAPAPVPPPPPPPPPPGSDRTS